MSARAETTDRIQTCFVRINTCEETPQVFTDCQRTIVLSLQDPEGVMAAQPFATKERYGCGVPLAGAITQNHLTFFVCSGEYETFLIRLPRRYAPRNPHARTYHDKRNILCEVP